MTALPNECDKYETLNVGPELGLGDDGIVKAVCTDSEGAICNLAVKADQRPISDPDGFRIDNEVRVMKHIAKCNNGPRFSPRYDSAWQCVDKDTITKYILMEKVEGVTLLDMVMKQQVSTSTLEQLAARITQMGQCGVMHGDLHAGNVIVSPNGLVTIIDFGNSIIKDAPDNPPRERLRSFNLNGRPEKFDAGFDFATIYVSLKHDNGITDSGLDQIFLANRNIAPNYYANNQMWANADPKFSPKTPYKTLARPPPPPITTLSSQSAPASPAVSVPKGIVNAAPASVSSSDTLSFMKHVLPYSYLYEHNQHNQRRRSSSRNRNVQRKRPNSRSRSRSMRRKGPSSRSRTPRSRSRNRSVRRKRPSSRSRTRRATVFKK